MFDPFLTTGRACVGTMTRNLTRSGEVFRERNANWVEQPLVFWGMANSAKI
jgi:hypothetical protein